MTGALAIEAWETENNAYLAEALSWLRDRLETHAERLLDADPGDAIDTVANRGGHVLAWTSADTPPALELLGDRFGISRFERLTLLLAASTELDPSIGARFARANSDPSAGFPTLALAYRSSRGRHGTSCLHTGRCATGASSSFIRATASRSWPAESALTSASSDT